MGAGGGIWAKDRDELLRPGFNGGGTGKPFDGAATTGRAKGATATGALSGPLFATPVGATGFSTFLGFSAALTDALGTGLATGLGVAFGATFADGLEAVFALIGVLGTDLLVNLVTDLPAGLAVVFLGCGLATADFFAAALLAVTLTGFLAATVTFANEVAFALATAVILPPGLFFVADCTAVLAAEFASLPFLLDATALTEPADFALAAGLPGVFCRPLDMTTDFFSGLAPALTVDLDFFICTFTTCLLWQYPLLVKHGHGHGHERRLSNSVGARL